ncbi:hypothetical protein EW146_g10430 [Bondarzewia mesenterica]|uniref:Glutaredoxin domain-containing protein n=1 Tax=Bondarzewia mesenterica TaxID=1095465 RepID=A0A4V3XBW3_9AGAM|nr:hypothetical protein EW146_g10430 [Bondarzewia mesenterica]
MAHRRTDSARHLPSMPPSSPLPLPVIHDSSSRLSPSPSLSSLVDIIHPRKNRQRTTFLALFALIAVSVYIFLVAQPTLVTPIPLQHPNDDTATWRHVANSYVLKHRKAAGQAPNERPQVSLDTAQELAAITSFMAALPQNVIPSTVDPSLPIDPQLVLDFDTRSPRATAEVDEVVSDVWTRNPVVLFSKLHSPVSREIKQLIYDMKLRPSSTVFEVDQRADADVLMPLLFRLTSSDTLPILLVGGNQ